jgi:hypothetical protein
MSDLDLTKSTNFTQNQHTGSQSLKDQAADAGAEIRKRAGDALRDSTEVARDKFKEAADAAKEAASGAEYVEDAARKIRDGSFRDLIDGATDFAKRQPAAFLGISVLTGFAVVRFLRASGGQSSASQGSNRQSAEVWSAGSSGSGFANRQDLSQR